MMLFIWLWCCVRAGIGSSVDATRRDRQEQVPLQVRRCDETSTQTGTWWPHARAVWWEQRMPAVRSRPAAAPRALFGPSARRPAPQKSTFASSLSSHSPD
eukprot:3914794-Prymnesium_polylepis.1